MKVEVRAMGKIEGYGNNTVSVLGNSIGGEVRGDGLAICASEELEAGVCRCSDLPALSGRGVHKHEK